MLVQIRISDPSYKAPEESMRRLFRSENKNKTLASTDSWKFSAYEVSRGVACFFAEALWRDNGVLQALLAMAASGD